MMDGEVKVYVTHIIDPQNFWARIGSDDALKTIFNFVDSVNYYGQTSVRQTSSEMGVPLSVNQRVIGRSSMNGGHWRNAVIMNPGYSDSDDVDVLYLDFGTTEIIPRNQLIIHNLPQMVLESVFSVCHCQLDDVLPVAQSWSPRAIAEFSDLVLNKTLRANIVSHELGGSHGNFVTLDLLDNSELGSHIKDVLIAHGVAKPSTIRIHEMNTVDPEPLSQSVGIIPPFDVTNLALRAAMPPSPDTPPPEVRDFEREELLRGLDVQYGYGGMFDGAECQPNQIIDINRIVEEQVRLALKSNSQSVCTGASFDHSDVASQNSQQPTKIMKRCQPNRLRNVPRSGPNEKPLREWKQGGHRDGRLDNDNSPTEQSDNLKVDGRKKEVANEKEQHQSRPQRKDLVEPKDGDGTSKKLASDTRLQKRDPVESKDGDGTSKEKLAMSDTRVQRRDPVESKDGDGTSKEKLAASDSGRNKVDSQRSNKPSERHDRKNETRMKESKHAARHGDQSAVEPVNGLKSEQRLDQVESGHTRQSTLSAKSHDTRKQSDSAANGSRGTHKHSDKLEQIIVGVQRQFDELLDTYGTNSALSSLLDKLRKCLSKATEIIDDDVAMRDKPLTLCLDSVVNQSLRNHRFSLVAVSVISEFQAEEEFSDVMSYLLQRYANRCIKTGNSERHEGVCTAFCIFLAELYIGASTWPDCWSICLLIHSLVDKWAVFDRKGQNSGNTSILDLYTKCLHHFIGVISKHSIKLLDEHFPTVTSTVTEKLMCNALPFSVKDKLLSLILMVEREKVRQSGDVGSICGALVTTPHGLLCSREVQTDAWSTQDAGCQVPDTASVSQLDCNGHVPWPDTSGLSDQFDLMMKLPDLSTKYNDDNEFPSLSTAANVHEKKHELYVYPKPSKTKSSSLKKNAISVSLDTLPASVQDHFYPVATCLPCSSGTLQPDKPGGGPPEILTGGGGVVWCALRRKSSSPEQDESAIRQIRRLSAEKCRERPIAGCIGTPVTANTGMSLVLGNFLKPDQLPDCELDTSHKPVDFVPILMCTLCGETTHTIQKCSRNLGQFFCDL